MNALAPQMIPCERASFRRVWKPMLAIFGLAWVLRLAVLLLGYIHGDDQGNNPAFYWYDSGQYLAPAQSLLANGTYSVNVGGREVPYFMRPPAYPLFIAACYAVGGEGVTSVLLPQILLGALVCSLTYWLGAMLFNHRAGFIAGLLMTFDQVLLAYSNKIVSEIFSLAWLLVSTILLMLFLASRRKWVLGLSAIALAVCTLSHTSSVYYWVVAIVALAVCTALPARERLSAALFFLIPFFGLCGLWLMRNYLVFGVFELGPKSAPIAYVAAEVLWRQHPQQDFMEFKADYFRSVNARFTDQYGIPADDWSDPETRRRYYRHYEETKSREAACVLREHWGTYARMAAGSFLKMTLLPLPYAELCRFMAAQGPGEHAESARRKLGRATKGLLHGAVASFWQELRGLPLCKVVGFGWNILYWFLTIPAAVVGGWLILSRMQWFYKILLLGTIAYFAVVTSVARAGDGMQRYRIRILPYVYCVTAVGWSVVESRRGRAIVSNQPIAPTQPPAS